MTLTLSAPWLVAALAVLLGVFLAARRPSTALALFDLVAGPALDKTLLREGIRTGSARREVLLVSAAVVLWHLGRTPVWGWVEITALGFILVALDIQGAIATVPAVALQAAGAAVGAAAAGARSAYAVARSTWAPPPPPSHEDLP